MTADTTLLADGVCSSTLGVKEVFLDENADEQVLMELKQLWEKKLADSKAIEPQEPPAPLVKVSFTGSTYHLSTALNCVQSRMNVNFEVASAETHRCKHR